MGFLSCLSNKSNTVACSADTLILDNNNCYHIGYGCHTFIVDHQDITIQIDNKHLSGTVYLVVNANQVVCKVRNSYHAQLLQVTSSHRLPSSQLYAFLPENASDDQNYIILYCSVNESYKIQRGDIQQAKRLTGYASTLGLFSIVGLGCYIGCKIVLPAVLLASMAVNIISLIMIASLALLTLLVYFLAIYYNYHPHKITISIIDSANQKNSRYMLGEFSNDNQQVSHIASPDSYDF
jgi:hypothetical protein